MTEARVTWQDEQTGESHTGIISASPETGGTGSPLLQRLGDGHIFTPAEMQGVILHLTSRLTAEVEQMLKHSGFRVSWSVA
jgi:hypothetical protein